MLVGMSSIQNLAPMLADPLYRVAVVISSLLVFSGPGLLAGSCFKDKPPRGINFAASGTGAFSTGICLYFEKFPGAPGQYFVPAVFNEYHVLQLYNS